MSEIKPVYQRRIQDDDWQEIEHSEYVEFSERGKFQTRILYPAAAYEALQKENAEQAKRISELEAGVVDIRDWTARWTRPDHPIVTVANRLLAASKNGE